jgi:AcrR family transcriptional regulator
MSTDGVAAAGLRERKKQKTRETITRVALRLFAEHGYEETTIADIAEAAEVSPRTVFAYFPTKEDIFFCDLPDLLDRLAKTLRERPEGATTLDAVRDFVATLEFDDDSWRRKQIVAADENLRRIERAHSAGFEDLLLESIARDLGTGTDDLRAQIAAASMIAAFNALQEREHGETDHVPPEEIRAKFDDVLTFLRGGLEALARD